MALSCTIEPQVSIILPCRNERGHIKVCLASVLSQVAPEAGFEVIVADGMSDDGTRQNVEPLTVSDARVRIIDNPERIVSTGLNAAVRAARGEIIIRMDAHTEYAPDYVRQCVETLKETGADVVGGAWVAKGSGYVSRAVAAAFQSPFAVGGARGHDPAHEGPVDTVYLGCWRKEAFEKFGYFDEELVRNQDDEHNLRIIRGGGKIYQSPTIKSWYRPRSSLRALFAQYLQYGYWKVRVIQKHKLPASWRHLVPGAFVLTLGALFLLSAFSILLTNVSQQSSILHPLSSYLLFAVVGLYTACVLAASLITAAQAGWSLLPILPFVFPCYHFGYGIGFLRGIWDFVIRRKGAHKSFEALTR
ncbi:MAG: glycosyltransferase family 2 protein [Verrucomicrobia bacterium]|nr:glycosyltransferase family 2 protein [Verrucomicrobiota bacterium]